jgi:hypothetical protein
MKTFLRSIAGILTLSAVSFAQAGEKAVVIVVGQPISSEAQEVITKFTKCGFEHEVHVSQDGSSSTRTSTRTYRSPITDDFVQIVTANDKVQRLYWKPAPTTEADYWKTDFKEVVQISISIPGMIVSAERSEEKNKQNKSEMATPRKPSD